MFKYSFADTLLIYNQNPNAQAVASYNNWAKIGRGVMKNPSTIHIPSSKDENQSLKLYRFLHDFLKYPQPPLIMRF